MLEYMGVSKPCSCQLEGTGSRAQELSAKAGSWKSGGVCRGEGTSRNRHAVSLFNVNSPVALAEPA